MGATIYMYFNILHVLRYYEDLMSIWRNDGQNIDMASINVTAVFMHC